MCQYFCCQSRACSVCCTIWCIFGFLITGFFSILSDSDKVYALVGVTGTNNTNDAVGAFAGSGTLRVLLAHPPATFLVFFIFACLPAALLFFSSAFSAFLPKALWYLGAPSLHFFYVSHSSALCFCCACFIFPAAIYAVCSIGCGICWIYHDFIKKKKLVKRKYTTEVCFALYARTFVAVLAVLFLVNFGLPFAVCFTSCD